MVEVAQGGADQARLVQRVRGAQRHESSRSLGAGPTGRGRGAREREPAPQRVDHGDERLLAAVRAVEGDLERRAGQGLAQPGGGIGQGAAEGVHRRVGAAGHQHLRPGRGERDDEVDAGDGEVVRVVDHHGAEGGGEGRVRQEHGGAAHQRAGVEAGAGVERGGGLEVEHPEVVAQQRGGVAPGGAAVLAAELLERGGAEAELPGAGDQVAQLGAEAGQGACAGVDVQVPGGALGDQLGEQGILLGAGDQGRLAQPSAQRVGAGDRMGEGGRGHGAGGALSVDGERVAQAPGGEAARRQQQGVLPGGVGRGEREGGAPAAGPAVDDHVVTGGDGVQGAALARVQLRGGQQRGKRLEIGSEQADALPRDGAGASHGTIGPHGPDVRDAPHRPPTAVQCAGSPDVPNVRFRRLTSCPRPPPPGCPASSVARSCCAWPPRCSPRRATRPLRWTTSPPPPGSPSPSSTSTSARRRPSTSRSST